MNERHRRRLLLVALAVWSTAAACRDPGSRQFTGGDSSRGRELLREYGCQSCHLIPGVRGADGLVGPPLIHWSRRVYIAGQLPNTSENLIRWIMAPQEVDPPTAMPDMGVTEQDARDIAAYLYTLR